MSPQLIRMIDLELISVYDISLHAMSIILILHEIQFYNLNHFPASKNPKVKIENKKKIICHNFRNFNISNLT